MTAEEQARSYFEMATGTPGETKDFAFQRACITGFLQGILRNLIHACESPIRRDLDWNLRLAKEFLRLIDKQDEKTDEMRRL